MKSSLAGKLTIIFICAIGVTVLTISVQSFLSLNKALDAYYKMALESAEEQLLSALSVQSNSALSLAESVAGIAPVAQAFHRRDRALLLQQTDETFKKMKEMYGIRQFQFHIPPATSFLRVHKPEKYDDDLSSFRETVVIANATRKPVKGIEVGVAGLGVRGVAPVSYEGRHVGTVEFGLSLRKDFFLEFSKRTGKHIIFLLDRNGKREIYAQTMGGTALIPLLSKSLRRHRNFQQSRKSPGFRML